MEEVWKRNNGQISLQEQPLCCIEGATEIKIPTVKSGSVILKDRLQHKRVLLLLDNVYRLEQLQALCGSHEWFGEGSKIFIMTTDRHLLKEHGVDHVYRVKELEESESYELFNWAAFNQACLPEGFAELSRQVVAYCGGLPLALELLGLYLHGSEVLKWKGVLRSLERFSIPSGQLVEALEKSFRYLSDEEKQIFLDIACFLIGMNQNDVLQTLNMSMQCTTLQISLLEDKSFVTIDENNKLQMHVMQQAMARDIVTRQSSKKTDQMSGYLPSNMGLFDRPPHASTTRLVRPSPNQCDINGGRPDSGILIKGVPMDFGDTLIPSLFRKSLN
ncbi:NB-ARC domain disease resistance protein [Medicago truncatula]|uniref:NB-ARC domain disease resistance protein n=1 Tax=Medicago truncatula TaxID=3880 RepID=G7JSC7_MEDTR|nr:NB-ARC domain disease resistance protein [Medicago truncatula]